LSKHDAVELIVRTCNGVGEPVHVHCKKLPTFYGTNTNNKSGNGKFLIFSARKLKNQHCVEKHMNWLIISTILCAGKMST